MTRSEPYRHLVTARAGGSCEYCRLQEAGSGVTFHVDHVFPRTLGGKTTLSNLALGCPGCNLAKAQQIEGEDREGIVQPLFNPRSFEPWLLGWYLHFALDHDSGLVLPRTGCGEATVETLQMNAPARVFARRLQIRAGLIA